MEVHDDIDQEEDVRHIVQEVGHVILIQSLLLVVRHLDGYHDTIVDGEDHDQDIPVLTPRMILLDDVLRLQLQYLVSLTLLPSNFGRVMEVRPVVLATLQLLRFVLSLLFLLLAEKDGAQARDKIVIFVVLGVEIHAQVHIIIAERHDVHILLPLYIRLLALHS